MVDKATTCHWWHIGWLGRSGTLEASLFGWYTGYLLQCSFLQHLDLPKFLPLGEIITITLATRDRLDAILYGLQSLGSRLHKWYDNLPKVLRINDAKRLGLRPPPHILSPNLLYHTFLIVLYRQYLQASQLPSLQPRVNSVCVSQAKIVHEFFIISGKSFNYKLMTYLVSYCGYTAAAVDVSEMTSEDSQARNDAATRLSVALKVLKTEARQTPGIRRSIGIIKRRLSTGRGGANG